MHDQLPIACSLSADDLGARRAEIASLGREALRSAETAGARSVLRFRRDDGVRERIESFVSSESRCCPFFDFSLRDEDDTIVLEVRAPADAAPVIAELAAAFEERAVEE